MQLFLKFQSIKKIFERVTELENFETRQFSPFLGESGATRGR